MGDDGRARRLTRAARPPELRTIVTEAVGTPAGVPLEPTLARADGNPLFALELARHGGRPDGPIRLSDVLLERIGQLATEASAAVQIAALLGARFPRPELDLALSIDGGVDTAGLVDTLLAAAVLVTDAHDTVRFVHPLVRDAVIEDLPPSVVAALHAEIAEEFAGRCAPGRVAYHVLRAGDALRASFRPTAAAVLIDAATTVATPDFVVACLERAATLVTADDSVRPELALAYARAGRSQACLDELDELDRRVRNGSATLDPTRRAQLTALRVQAMLSLKLGASAVLGTLVDAIADPETDTDARATMLGDASFTALITGDNAAAAEYAQRSIAMEPEVTDPGTLIDALVVASWLASYALDFDAAIDYSNRALDAVARGSLAMRVRTTPEYFAGTALLDAARVREATEAILAGERAAIEHGVAWPRPFYSFGLAATRYTAGDFDGAMADVAAGLEIAADLESSLAVPFGHSIAALVAIARGDIDAATRSMQAAREIDDLAVPSVGLDHVALATARLLEVQGDPDAAYEHLTGAFDFDVALGMLNDLVLLAPDVVALALARGDVRRAASTTAAMHDCAQRAGIPHFEACAWRVDALTTGSVAAAERAVEAARGHERLVERAGTIGDAAVVAAAARRDDDATARAWLDEALGLWESMGAERELARLLARARDAGIRTRRRARRATASVGWDALSPTELAVARLVADGLSNREVAERLFVSRRTVESHVQHCFVKVGVGSRAELAVAARQEGADRPPT